MAASYDLVVVGGGILGLATARQLQLDRPRLKVAVLEKEAGLASHQTGHNSGVVHSGVYYAPGSLKARLCIEGRKLLERYASDRNVPYIARGKLVVALATAELPRLAELERRARANGVSGLRMLDTDELRALEPNVLGIRALYAPGTAVTDYLLIAERLAADVRAAGGEIFVGCEVTTIRHKPHAVQIETKERSFTARAAVVCAGLQSDRLAHADGTATVLPRIVPFRGDYYTVIGTAGDLIDSLVYPVPDPAFPFLGIHLTKGTDGIVRAGPNAVLSLAREGYGRTALSPRDVAATMAYGGFWRFAGRNLKIGAAEAWRDFSKRSFVAAIQRYVPGIGVEDVRFGPSGIRAQALDRAGRLVDDFVFSGTGRTLHVVNAPSPGATSSLAIAQHIASMALKQLE